MTPDESDKTCTNLHELIPAYCLGATDLEETRLVAAHLAECTEASAEAARYQALADTLLFSAPAMSPPAALADKLWAATTPARRTTPADAPSRQPSLWQRASAALAALGARPLPALAAIALIALLAVNVYLVSQVSVLRTAVAAMQTQVGKQTAVLTQVGHGSYLRIGLPAGPAGEATEAYATVVCSPEEPQGFLLAEHLPPLAPDQDYQIWLEQGGAISNAGSFQPDEAGYGKVVFTAALPMGQYDALSITAETGAVSQPTTPPVIAGPLYTDEY